MKKFYLIRISDTKYGTFGVLVDSSMIPFALTLEPEWQFNKRDVSCIPTGMYTCLRKRSQKYNTVFEVKDVQDRTDILIHMGNVEEDTKGCILVGEEFGVLNGKPAVLSSKRGFIELIDKLQGDLMFQLIICKMYAEEPNNDF